MIRQKRMTPRIASTPIRQFRTIQLILSATAIATRQIPKTVKKITERRRPVITPRGYRIAGCGLKTADCLDCGLAIEIVDWGLRLRISGLKLRIELRIEGLKIWI